MAGMEISYKPGDHLGVFACNRSELVDGIIERIQTTIDPDIPIELQVQKQSHTPNGIELKINKTIKEYLYNFLLYNNFIAGIVKTWAAHDRYLPNSLRILLTRFLDITTPPTPNLLRYFASIAQNPKEQAKLNLLASVSIQLKNIDSSDG